MFRKLPGFEIWQDIQVFSYSLGNSFVFCSFLIPTFSPYYSLFLFFPFILFSITEKTVCVPLGFCTLEKLKPYTISSLQAGSLTRLPNTVLSLMEGTQKVFLFLGFLNLNYFQLTKGSEHTIMPQKQNKKNCLFFCTLHSLSVFTNELHGILSGV